MRRGIHAALGRGLVCVAIVAVAASAAAGAEDLAAIKARLGRQAKIVNGVLEADHANVGALLFGSNPNTASTWCSGTMIGCQTFLTAGHCVDGYTAANFTVFLPSAGFFSVASIAQIPSFSFPERDVAVITLGASIDGVAPTPINASVNPPAGSAGTIVGFGRSGGNSFDYGLKRSGSMRTIACPAGSFYSGSVCWLYSAPLGPPGSNSDTCNADSGGPLFMDFGSGDTVAGITSGGTSDNCNPGDLSYDANVFLFHTFIEGVAGADLANTSCGTLPQVGSALTSVVSANGALDAGTPQAVHSFDVAPGTAMLRVAMTGTEDDASDFDMYVKQGSAPTTAVYDCRDIGPNQYNFCEFANPASGTWYVMARRESGLGQYQITATAFGRDCSVPANAGLSCDDGNPCTSGDVCGAGVCAGTPSVDGTPCDDGSTCTGPDSCQAGACTGAAVANGTPCDDGNPCSSPDLCQAGACVGTTPAASCKAPFVSGRSLFQLKDRSPDTGDRLSWKWLRGSQTSLQDFGDPTVDTDYWLCAYDQTGGISHRILKQQLPAGSRWLAYGNGFKYRDPDAVQSGIYSALLKQGGDGQARIIVHGKGQSLGMPPLALHQDSTVTVQLLNGAACWEAEYSSNLRNDATQFKARGD